jgi:WD40 repeat protein
MRLRIFVSSPGDVPDERLRAGLVIDKLAQEFRRYVSFEVIRWEHEPLIASGHFQDALDPPSAADIVILILWSRLGTPLPEKTALREYRGIDGRTPVTGTEWEFEEALKAARERGAPDLLAFRNTSPTPIDPRDPDARAKSIAQLDALDAFWRRHFADRGVFLAAYDEYATLEQFAARLEESLRKLIERRIAALPAGEGGAATWFGPPFRGLQAYGFEHAPIYFGRDEAVAKAAEQLAGNARAGTAFLLVSGASGSGKSSLVHAALLPRLMQPQRIEGVSFTRRLVFRLGGGGDPLQGLVGALTRTPATEGIGLPELLSPGQNAAELAAHLRERVDKPGFLFAGALGRITEAGRASGRLLAFESAKLILVIDQLEELFTTAAIGADDRRLFLRMVAGLARSGAVWVIATLRADFWHHAAEIPELLDLAQGHGRIDLTAPSPAELAEMIRKPAQAAGLGFETHEQSGLGLDAVIMQDAEGAPGVLPLLSFVLDEVYAEDVGKRDRRALTFATYAALGGLRGAMSKRAEDAVADLSDAARAAVPQVLRTLVTITGGSEQAVVARIASIGRFADATPARAVVDALVGARLIVAAGANDTATVRLAHEALITHWERARTQFAADRRDLETRALVEQQQARWEKAGGKSKRQLLLRDPDLANAVDLGRRWGDELEVGTRAYISASRRRAQMLQSLIVATAAVFALLAVGATVLGIAALHSEQRAANNLVTAQLGQSRFLADLATQNIRAGDIGTAVALALEALPDVRSGVSRPYAAEAELALFSAWQDLREAKVLAFEGGSIQAISPDFRRVLTVSEDHAAGIWDAETGKVIALLRGHEGFERSASFSSDGRRVVTASDDNPARIWDAETGELIAVLQGHDDGVVGVRIVGFSADGRRVSMFRDKTASIWNAETGMLIAVLQGHGARVQGATFSADGRRIVTASEDKTARIWDVETGKVIAVLQGHEGAVVSATFSPDGRRVVTASADRTARIWDAETGELIAVLQGHTSGGALGGGVVTATFSPDGRRVVTASLDKTARVWEVETGKVIAVLQGHYGGVVNATFSPDGRRIVTASWDHTARIWDAESGKEIAVLAGHEGHVQLARFSPDGRLVVTQSWDMSARIWDVESRSVIAVLRGHEGHVSQATFSADDRRIVTASDDATARIWDAEGGRVIAVLRGHERAVWSAAFSPDGRRIVTASEDRTARIWDVETREVVAVLAGHQRSVESAAFSPDSRRVVTASDDETARIWDAETGNVIAVLQGHEGRVASATFSPDGRRVVTGSSDTTARIWDVETRKVIAVLQGHQGTVDSAMFSADGRRVVTAASHDNSVRIWDVETGKVITVLKEDESSRVSVMFSPDGRRIITTQSLPGPHIWDIGSGKVIAVLGTLEKYGDPAWGATFSSDGRRVATVSFDKTAAIWQVFATTQDLVEEGKKISPRCLTPDQRTKAFLDPDPPAWCIEMEKWPYRSQDWKDWLRFKRANADPPLPNTAEWKDWIAVHR